MFGRTRRPHSTVVVPGEALRVAMAVRPHDRVVEGVVRRRLARWRHAEDLSRKRVEVLGRSTQAGLAGPGIEHAVGAEADPTAVVDSGLRDARENGMGGPELAAAVLHPDDPVISIAGEVRIEPAVLVEVGRDREAEQSALATGYNARHLTDGGDPAGWGHALDPCGVPLGYQCAPVRQEDQTPWAGEAAGDDPGGHRF